MKQKIFPLLLVSLSIVSCGTFKKVPKTSINPLTNRVDSMSYSLGVNIGTSLAKDLQVIPGGVSNKNLLLKGFEESLNCDSTLILSENAREYVANYFQSEREKENKRLKKTGEDFLAKNAKKENVVVTSSGLQYLALTHNVVGQKPLATDKVKVHYTGTTIDGKVFDSSVKRGTPAEFRLNGVIKGWTEGLQLMTVGSKFKFFIPYFLAYGERGQPRAGIKPFSPLIFEVELLEIIK